MRNLFGWIRIRIVVILEDVVVIIDLDVRAGAALKAPGPFGDRYTSCRLSFLIMLIKLRRGCNQI